MTATDTLKLSDFEPLTVSELILERTHLSFFYIGIDERLLQHIMVQFESGYRRSNLPDAAQYIQQLYLNNEKLPDVIFIDLPFQESELQLFCLKLKENILLATLPLIYNEHQLSDQQFEKLRHSNLIDDIISLGSNKINYYSKIVLLKQSKLFNGSFSKNTQPTQYKIIIGKGVSACLKRFLDVTISLTAIVLLSPILLLIAIAIKLESKGPVIYTSFRAGRGFRVFRIFKFRTMHVNADKQVENLLKFNQYAVSVDGPKFFKLNNDPRITKLGKLLRNTSVDELPQLFNVLWGDMSIVGNRPLPLYEAVSLITNESAERFSAPAGITGLWQVKKRGNAEMSIEDRINLDIMYSRNNTVLYDLMILARTPAALIQKGNV